MPFQTAYHYREAIRTPEPEPGVAVSVLARKETQAAGLGVHGTPVDVPACFIRLTAVESRGLESHFAVRNAPGEDIVGDVSGILPVVTDGSLR